MAQKAQIALSLTKKITFLAEYVDFVNVFLKMPNKVLLEQTRIIKHAIKLKKGKKPLYRPIYSLNSIVLKIFKIYIKTNFARGFIRLFKFLADSFILFVLKSKGIFYFCIDDKNQNNLTVRN